MVDFDHIVFVYCMGCGVYVQKINDSCEGLFVYLLKLVMSADAIM